MEQKAKKPIITLRVVILAAIAVVLSVAVAWHAGLFQPAGTGRPTNAIIVIMPYRYAGTWAFDDPSTGLKREPFVAGIPEMIDHMVRDIPDAEKGFRLLFSTQPFPGYMLKLTWRRPANGGNWYYCEQAKKEGWLCPAMFKYYDKAPKELYAKAEKKGD